jgi:flagellar motor protein MotB
MRKLLVPVAFLASMLMVGISGCKVFKEDSANPDQAQEMERLRAENAALKAGQRQPTTPATNTPPATKPSTQPTTISPGSKKRLEGEGIEVSQTPHGVRLTLHNKILFSAGKADLRADSKKALAEAAKVIKHEFSTSALLIEGHTDNQPIKHAKYTSNQELSVARAKAVAAALQKEGLKNKMKVEGLGETRPLNGNKTNEEKAQNRRVEIFIANPGTIKDATTPAPEIDEGS